MISRQVKCDKCGLMIISQNKFIHDAQCNPVINNQNNFSFSINQNNSNPNQILGNSNNSLINSAILRSSELEEDFWFCNKCQNFVDIMVKDDHMLSHQLQEENSNEENLNDTDEFTTYDMNQENDSRIQTTSGGNCIVRNQNILTNRNNLNLNANTNTNINLNRRIPNRSNNNNYNNSFYHNSMSNPNHNNDRTIITNSNPFTNRTTTENSTNSNDQPPFNNFFHSVSNTNRNDRVNLNTNLVSTNTNRNDIVNLNTNLVSTNTNRLNSNSRSNIYLNNISNVGRNFNSIQTSINDVDYSGREVVINNQNPGNNTTTITRTINHPNGATTVITTSRTASSSNSNRSYNFQQPQGNSSRSIYHNHEQFILPEFFLSQNVSHPNHHILGIFGNLIQSGMIPRSNPVNSNHLSALPEMTISDLSKIPADKKDCVICLCNYELNEKAIILPCTHIFHSECIKSWFLNHDTCPICKIKINESTLNGVNQGM